jgi:DNA-binding NtrC family response regulator
MTRRVLILDDDPAMGEVLVDGLGHRGYDATALASPGELERALEGHGADVLLTDLRMPGTSGIAVCEWAHAAWPDLPVVVMTGFGSVESAVAAMKAGAFDYVTKPVDLDKLELVLARALELRAIKLELAQLREAVRSGGRDSGLIGESAAMRALRDLIDRVAASDATVLITGESGTGKELVARAIHQGGARAKGPFVALNCAAVPEALMESELFGHVRGAFTDARADKPGLLVQASGGTLLLDEIGDTPMALQVKLLRALQERRVRPVGATRERPFDARVLTSTHQDLDLAVSEGRFREDLFYRLNVIQVEVPPLRARGADVLLLAEAFLARAAARTGRAVRGLDAGSARSLLGHAWPGNVRELENAIERGVALARGEQILPEDLPPRLREAPAAPRAHTVEAVSALLPLDEIERQHVLRVLEAVSGNKREAARILGVDRKTLYRKIERWG